MSVVIFLPTFGSFREVLSPRGLPVSVYLSTSRSNHCLTFNSKCLILVLV